MNQPKSELSQKRILLGVSGGIAAYKAADLASKLTKSGAQVRAVMTENSLKLICAKTFEAITGGPVYTSMWSDPQQFEMNHISLADWADIVVVAPATADIIAKKVCGICDDLLSTILCVCWEKPTVFAPAMNERMWRNPITAANIEKLKQSGVKIAGPAEGHLACGVEGVGRMSEPADIVSAVKNMA